MRLYFGHATVVVSMFFLSGQHLGAADSHPAVHAESHSSVSVAASDGPTILGRTAPVARSAPATESAVISDNREVDIRRTLAAEQADNPNLLGAWLELTISEDRRKCTVVPSFDQDRVEEQKSELTIVLKRLLGDVDYQIAEHKTLPITKFIEALNAKIAADPSLAGSQVTGAFFQPAGGGAMPDLMLLGRFTTSAQQAQLQNLAIALQQEAFANSLKKVLVKTDRLTADLTALITDEREIDIRGRLTAAVAQNPNLHGAWLEVVIAEDRRSFLLQPILDEDRAKELEADLKIVVEDVFGNVKYQMLPQLTRPVTKFVEVMQDLADTQPELSGCLITGAFFQPGEGGGYAPDLMLLGRYSKADQQGYVQSAAIAVKEGMFSAGMRGIAVKTDEMHMVESSPEIASYMFNDGVNAFRRNDYEDAQEAFERCVLEAPGRLDYKYWRIVNEIAKGDVDRAYKHLRPLVTLGRSRSSFFSSDYEGVLRSLEQVQGPIRQKLGGLEKRALLEGASDSL